MQTGQRVGATRDSLEEIDAVITAESNGPGDVSFRPVRVVMHRRDVAGNRAEECGRLPPRVAGPCLVPDRFEVVPTSIAAHDAGKCDISFRPADDGVVTELSADDH